MSDWHFHILCKLAAGCIAGVVTIAAALVSGTWGLFLMVALDMVLLACLMMDDTY